MLLDEYDRLTRPGVLAHYKSVEVIEVVGFPEAGEPVNLLTVATCEDLAAPLPAGLEWIDGGFSIAGLKGWRFGLVQYRRTLEEFRAALERLVDKGVWSASGYPLQVGNLDGQPPIFVPSDGFETVPLNAVLKNNFYNGSYVLEVADPDKANLKAILETPALLGAIARVISGRSGPALDGVSDRLGNILVQFPIDCMALTWARRKGGVEATLDWRPGVAPRPVAITCAVETDGVLAGFASATITTGTAFLNVGHCRHPHRIAVWDEANGVLLAATSPNSFLSMGTAASSSLAGDRRFVVDGSEVRVPVVAHHPEMTVGKPPKDPNGVWEGRRLYRSGSMELARNREFVAYGGGRETAMAGRKRALQDLDWLIDRHGQEGIWLWDPYLDATDILRTLCRNRHAESPMRALTEGLRSRSGVVAEEEVAGQTASGAWIEAQRRKLETDMLEPVNLKLEFRISRGIRGWRFHDRFLIFPRPGRAALVWSLGTSVNHAGAAHHILQKVPDGQRIEDDFGRLWDGLTEAEHRIWQCP